MLSDRFYMRDDYPRRSTSILIWILCAMGAGFITQLLFGRWISTSAGSSLEYAMGLSPSGLLSGHVWSLISYAFLHDTRNILHVVFNGLMFYFFGKEILPQTGTKKFLWLWFVAIAAGGAFWLAANWQTGGLLIGASAGVMALLVVFACLNPNQPITLLLFFILPVTIKPKYLALGMLAFDLLGFLFFELPSGGGMGGVAHSAHLGGMAIGWLYYKQVHLREWRNPDRAQNIELPQWFQRKKTAPPPIAKPTFKVNLTTRESLQAEVDRILDKISSKGFASLTAEEKRTLDEARDMLSKG